MQRYIYYIIMEKLVILNCRYVFWDNTYQTQIWGAIFASGNASKKYLVFISVLRKPCLRNLNLIKTNWKIDVIKIVISKMHNSHYN